MISRLRFPISRRLPLALALLAPGLAFAPPYGHLRWSRDAAEQLESDSFTNADRSKHTTQAALGSAPSFEFDPAEAGPAASLPMEAGPFGIDPESEWRPVLSIGRERSSDGTALALRWKGEAGNRYLLARSHGAGEWSVDEEVIVADGETVLFRELLDPSSEPARYFRIREL